jgi:hypothetical protein
VAAYPESKAMKRKTQQPDGRTWRLYACISIGFLPQTTRCGEISPTSSQVAGSMWCCFPAIELMLFLDAGDSSKAVQMTQETGKPPTANDNHENRCWDESVRALE